jgi:serine protease Do
MPEALTPVTHASFAPALARANPFTVGVYSLVDVDRLSFGEPPTAKSQIGAGFRIDASGLIVTAAHVVAGARRVVVKLADSRVACAELIASDDETDIALLRIPIEAVRGPVFGRTASLKTGDWVLAIGEPYGLNRSVVAGIVGGKDRHFADDGEMLFIQSDVLLNPGPVSQSADLVRLLLAWRGVAGTRLVVDRGADRHELSLP